MTTESSRMLGSVQEEHAFRIKDGESIRSLKELYTALQAMEHDVFRHHCNEERNDFGNWIKDVHKDYKLANSLFSSKTKEEFTRAVGSRIYDLEKAIAPPQHSIAIKQESSPMVAQKLQKPSPKLDKAKANKKTRPAATPGRAAKVKSDVELAKERLEQILIDSVKQKMDRMALEKAKKDKENNEEVNAAPDFRLEEKVHKPTASEILSDIDAPAGVPEKNQENGECIENPAEEMLQFTEVKSFPKQLKDEMSTVFRRSSMNEFKSDMKKLFATGENRKEPDAAPRTLAILPESGDVDKDEMLSHLKRVFK